MKAIVQRVAKASVSVDNVVISQISRGFMVLIGVGRDDTQSDIESLAKKILALRAFPDPNSGAQWKKTVKDVEGAILCVSQFTLFAKTPRGRPDFHGAMPTERGREMYAAFLKRLGELYQPQRIKDGQFGAMMDVSLTNEGPVTFTIESQEKREAGIAADESRSANGQVTAPVVESLRGEQQSGTEE
ncbi:D-tyrosyl-tRNA deacylase [Exidia glandulosa HHB12029]|uniref:D-aminoacyl-tRNA deacylase n=1 Tax=Exidia glandulosa HHB12029 TaxID=1314781 RepID=A0A165F3A9_EXIGL|nr:D-tyrosyl-tRNA deacylase [Exidia glandulosa HHB12029]